MGACKRRGGESKNVAPSGSRSGAGASTSSQSVPSGEQFRDLWMAAVEEESAVMASQCARFCDTLRGAEAFAACDGLDAFQAVAMGQSMKSGQGGLMVALAQALMRDMTEFKTAIFETLAASAKWPSLRGRIAGSGVLGVVTATMLAPRHGPASKALMVRLAGLLGVDAPETKRLGDPRREEEFVKLRTQLISSGAVKAFAGMVRADRHPRVAVAAAESIAGLAGFSGDQVSRKALLEVCAIPALLSRVPGWTPQPEDEPVELPTAPVANMFSDEVAQQDAGQATSSDSAAAAAPVAAPDAGSSSSTADAPAAKDVDGASEASGDDEHFQDLALRACLSSLVAVAAADSADCEGLEELKAPMRRPHSIERFRTLVSDVDSDREVACEALRCLAALGRPSSAGDPSCWPLLAGEDPDLTSDIARLITFGSDTCLEVIVGLLGDRKRAAKLGDLRPIRRAVKAKTGSSGPVGLARKALGDLTGCDHCGCCSEATLLLCTGCRTVEYCSRDCQKVAWKTHKVTCVGKKK